MKTLSSSGKLLSPGGLIARKLKDYEPRPEQVEMAGAVEKALAAREHLMVEAGTGVGKTFAYLIPAIERVTRDRERAVISTRTIALQEQLMNKDIPFLQSVMPCEFTAVLVKGRTNYVGLRRLEMASKRQDLLFPRSADRQELWRIEDWATTTNDGSLADLVPAPAHAVWGLSRSEHGNCMGRRCPHYEPCFYQRARRRAGHAQILVVNHALFFSDLALRAQGSGFLPEYDFAILDEAHTIEGIAADHFGFSVSDAQVYYLLNTLCNERTGHGFLACCHADEAVNSVGRTRRIAREFFDSVTAWQRTHGRSNGRLAVPMPVENTLSSALRSLGSRLLAVRGQLGDENDRFEMTSYVDRAVELAGQIDMLIDQEREDWVYWLDVGSNRTQDRRQSVSHGADSDSKRVSLCTAPIDVSEALKDALFGRISSVVMTSATLATDADDTFEFLRTRLGVKQTGTLRLGSPFDFASQMAVHVESWLPDPADREAYVGASCDAIARHVEETVGKTLVLFTSYEMLNECAARLSDFFAEQGLVLLVQGGEDPRTVLLDRFREDVDSVLFGTDSFWEGIDVCGEALSSVIIVKLPFAVPSLPHIEAKIERLRRQGENPFRAFQLPEAVLKFRQGAGRLIRSTRDRGRLVILDPRIVGKPYGRLFLDTLPDCSVTIHDSPPTT